jgi:hypothetical protein
MFRFARRFTLGFFLSFGLFSAGCGSTRSQPGTVQAASPGDEVPHSRDADDLARFIAGMKGNPGTPFAKLEDTEAWKDHQRRLDHAWHNAEGPLVNGIAEFGKRELSDLTAGASPVFYPFSGPDALTMVLDFPHSPSYLMVGLEPAGTLPAHAQIEKKDLPAYLGAMRETVASELGRSFFVTRQMDRQFRGQVTDGLLLPILHLLVRTHNTILGFRYVRLDDNGQMIEREPTYKAPGRIGNKGIEVEFTSDADHSLHRLYYFSVNLSDERLKENNAFLTYLANWKGVVTMLKATSYMPHHSDFSVIRGRILSQSAAVLQDDSGIPYHFFQPGAWSVVLYGDYTRPFGSFRWYEQPDLRKAYESGAAKPLSLRLGYGYSRIVSNLLVAKQVNPASTASRQ